MWEAWQKALRYSGWIAGIVGVVATFVGGWGILEIWIGSQNQISWISNIYVVIVSFVILFTLSVRHFQTMRKEKYANISSKLHYAIHQSRNIHTYLLENAPSDFSNQSEVEPYLNTAKSMFVVVLDHVATVFMMITGTKCRTSIKLTYEIDGEVYFYTYTRDRESRENCRERDNKRVDDNNDPLDANSQFSKLFSNEHRELHYFSNDLVREARRGRFETTSTRAYDPNHSFIPGGNRGWNLPYKSTIACVIRQGECDQFEGRQQDVLGFLTVDSESRGVFIERWDVELAYAVADAMFHPLKLVIAAQREAERATGSTSR
jgi:hypothetical protein